MTSWKEAFELFRTEKRVAEERKAIRDFHIQMTLDKNIVVSEVKEAEEISLPMYQVI